MVEEVMMACGSGGRCGEIHCISKEGATDKRNQCLDITDNGSSVSRVRVNLQGCGCPRFILAIPSTLMEHDADLPKL